MGCFLALVFLAMIGAGGYGWYSTHQFLWWGVMCLLGVLGLVIQIVGIGGSGALGEITDIGVDLGDIGGFGD